MLEELQTPPSESEAPDQDTQGHEEAESVLAGAESSPEEDASSEETHPEGEEPEGGKKDEEEPFHVEGEKVFKTKEDFIKHVNKQRGAASEMASRYKKIQARLEALEKNVSAPPKQEEKQTSVEDELPEEQKEALQIIKKYGKFLTPEDLQTYLDQQLNPVRNMLQTFEQQKMEAARTAVQSFMDLNPDAVEKRDEIADTMEKLQRAGMDVTIDKAYLLVMGKAPRTQSAMQKEATIKAVKKMQAGGASSPSSGATKTESAESGDDILARILNF